MRWAFVGLLPALWAACPAGSGGRSASTPKGAGVAAFSVDVGATGSASVQGVGHHEDGGAYVVGTFEGSLALPRAKPLTSRGRSDGFVARVDKRGALRWATAFGGADTDAATALSGGGDRGVVIAAVIGHGAQVSGQPVQAPGHPASVVARLDATGRLLWQRAIGSTDYVMVTDVAMDATGAVVAVGSFAGTMRVGNTVITSAGAQDAFVLMLSSDGSPRWARRAGGPFPDFARAVAFAGGRVAVAGGFGVRADFDGRIIASRGSSLDAFIAVYKGDGSLAWVRRGGGEGRDAAQQIDLDDEGNVYAAGNFMGSGRFGGVELTAADESDVFLVSLDPVGLHRWSHRLGGKGIDTVGALRVRGARVTVAGSFTGLGLFGPRDHDSKGKNDVFVATYSSSGTPLSSRRYGGRGDESVASMALLPSGDVILGGSYTGAPDLGGAKLDARGPVAGFVVRLSRLAPP